MDEQGYVRLSPDQTPPQYIATASRLIRLMLTPVLQPDGITYRVWAAVTVTKEQLERMVRLGSP